jgi:predicted transcriptional regulator
MSRGSGDPIFYGNVRRNTAINKLVEVKPEFLGLTISSVRVLCALIRYYNPKQYGDQVFPSQERLAEELSLGVRTVARCIQPLIDGGFIKIDRTARNINYRYTLNRDLIGALIETAKEKHRAHMKAWSKENITKKAPLSTDPEKARNPPAPERSSDGPVRAGELTGSLVSMLDHRKKAS